MGKAFSRISGLFSSSSEPQTFESNGSPHSYSLHQTLPAQTTYSLATPRSPLLRTKRSADPSPVSSEEPLAKRIKGDFQYLNFAFLKDDLTINFIKKSKVMLIMRGPRSSGKSLISKEIQKVYEDTAVCSADHHFVHEDEDKSDKEKLRNAHKSCQQEVTSAASKNTHVIVIDNHCLQNSDMKFYLKLARSHKYIPVVVEPQTPWAVILNELAVKNSHNKPGKIFADKVISYQPVLPVYYGWFLNEANSEEICSLGLSWLQRALRVEDFMQEFLRAFQISSCEDLSSIYTWNSCKGGDSLLHVTSKYTARGETEGAKEYITSPLVRQSVGKCFRLCIIGFVITTRTIGARLKLTENQLEFWAQNDNEDPPATPSVGIINKNELKQTTTEENGFKNSTVCVPLVTTEEGCSTDRFHPTSGKGSRAHLTLACAPNIRPVTTGFDLIRAVRSEQKALMCDNQISETYTVDGGILRNYGDGVWVVYPQSEVVVSSLFSAFY